MNIVPLVPITMVRAAGWALDQTSALKPAGSLILSSGSLSTAVASGGVGCGRRLPSWLLALGLLRSSGLKPGGVCASAVVSPTATITAAAPSMDRLIVFMSFLSLSWPAPNPGENDRRPIDQRRLFFGRCYRSPPLRQFPYRACKAAT